MTKYEEMTKLNVNEHIEKRNGLSYLTWSWAWDYFKKAFPDAVYTVYKNVNGLPYAYDPNTGYMVYTSITADGTTHEMWLPVMDSANNAMKNEPYQYVTRVGKTVTVKTATMFDVNKTIMRCLVKNMAMFGLGLYIYAGEDLPEGEEAQEDERIKAGKENLLRESILSMADGDIDRVDAYCEKLFKKKFNELEYKELGALAKDLEKKLGVKE